MKTAILIDTPLQLLNAMNLVCTLRQKGELDAFIVPQFRNAEQIIGRVKETGIFNRVYTLKLQRLGKDRYFWAIFGLFAPRLYARKWLKLPRLDYDLFYLSDPTKMFEYIIDSNAKSANRIAYDDGIGSYTGDIFRGRRNKIYMALRKLMGKDYFIKEMYLNQPDYYEGTVKLKLHKIQDIQQNGLGETVRMVFDVKKSTLYSDYKYVYLNQPTTASKDLAHDLEVDEKILSVVGEEVGDNLLVRMHPRSKMEDYYGRFRIDDVNNMWEVICEEEIDGNSVLISSYSTTQFAPKFMHGGEPYLVFTVNLYKDLSNSVVGENDMLKRIKKAYSDESKIYVVHSYDELRVALREIKGALAKAEK